jgi:hypothetical protein
VSQVSNDDVHQGLETISGDKDIHSLSSVARKKVGDLLLNTFPLSKAIYATISQSVSRVVVSSFLQGQRSKRLPRSSMVRPH